uniref:Mytilin 1 n=1 Tax=Trichomya hirsuta TaxID=40252 RepID=A0A6B9XPY4_9BIVA|nr:mytilin 1 [Trichomya hirsuta]
MRAAIVLVIALAVLIAVHEADASCSSICRYRCRRCRGFIWINIFGRCYCKCYGCRSEQTIKFPVSGENERQSQIFPKMDGINNMEHNEYFQQGNGDAIEQQGELDM